MEDHDEPADDQLDDALDADATRSEHDRIDTFADADRERVAAANKLDRDRSMVAHGRRIGGLPGAMAAGALIAMRDIFEGPKRDEGSVVVDSPSEPHDVDRDGVALSADDIGGVQDIEVAALPRREPVVGTRRASRRRSR
jgi:hypothetical protein